MIEKPLYKKLLLSLAQLLRKIKHVNKFELSTKNPLKAQEKLLLKIVKANKDTSFGKKHKFKTISSVDDYQRNVPVNSYEDLSKYVNLVKEGQQVLTKETVMFFTTTSGTTGNPKFIPVNQSFLKAHKAGWETWFYYAAKDHPKIFDYKILAIISPAIEGYTKGSIPYGAMSGLTYEQEPKIIQDFYAIPEFVFGIKDYEARYYCILRIALEQKISMIVTPNPSMILLLCKKANEFSRSLIEDIGSGTLNSKYRIDRERRKKIESLISSNPERAQELGKLLEKHKTLLPKHYWPELELIACWTGGSMPLYIRRFKHYFGKTAVRDIGLLSSEGRVTIPVRDSTRSGILSVNTSFFEFIHEKDFKKKNPRYYLCNELKKGRHYYIILTNSSGLFRYSLNDVVKVTGFHNRTPLLEFLHKDEHTASITGEKLTEWQIVTCVHRCSRLLKLPVHAFTAAIKWAKVPCYELLMELHSNASSVKLRKFLRQFDKELQNLNVEYKNKRKSMRLAAPVLKIVKNGSYDKLVKHKVKKGTRDSQLKLPCLVQKLGFEKKFKIIKEVKCN